MKKIVFLVLSLTLVSTHIHAAAPHGPQSIEVNVSVGTEDGRMKFIPDTLTFERGKYYKLVISNPGLDEHYFTSYAFATHVFSRKVEVLDKAGNIMAEIHGAIHDMELKPGARVEWFFFPMTRAKGLKFFCRKAGHEAAGMLGSINIIGDL